VEICANTLGPFMPNDRLQGVTTETQGLNMLLAGRVELYCGSSWGMVDLLRSAEFRGVTTVRSVLAIDKAIPLHAFLHRRHTEFAPQLAAVLKQMKTEGLIERFRVESMQEAGRN